MEICQSNDCKKFDWATDPDERAKLWQARHNTWFAFKALHPNRRVERFFSYEFRIYYF